MKNLQSFLLLGLLFSVLIPRLSAQNGPSPTKNEAPKYEGELVVLHAIDQTKLYKGVTQFMMIKVVDLNNPCNQAGNVHIAAPDGWHVEELGNDRFHITPSQRGTNIHVYYEMDGQTIEAGAIAVELIEPDWNDPDFQEVYPDAKPNLVIKNAQSFRPDGHNVVANDHFTLFMPTASLQNLSAHASTRFHAFRTNGCEPMHRLLVEADGFKVQPSGSWNHFEAEPVNQPGRVTLNFYEENTAGEKVFLDNVQFRVGE